MGSPNTTLYREYLSINTKYFWSFLVDIIRNRNNDKIDERDLKIRYSASGMTYKRVLLQINNINRIARKINELLKELSKNRISTDSTVIAESHIESFDNYDNDNEDLSYLLEREFLLKRNSPMNFYNFEYCTATIIARFNIDIKDIKKIEGKVKYNEKEKGGNFDEIIGFFMSMIKGLLTTKCIMIY